MSFSPFTRRLLAKTDAVLVLGCRLALKDAKALERAFVEALKEEVEARFGNAEAMKTPFALIRKPLVIAGLGSFKMRTRPQAQFDSFKFAPRQSVMGDEGLRPTITKPPARRLVFTAKWEEIE